MPPCCLRLGDAGGVMQPCDGIGVVDPSSPGALLWSLSVFGVVSSVAPLLPSAVCTLAASWLVGLVGCGISASLVWDRLF